MNILFRADSSSVIGTGHIMRDIVLAQRYDASNVFFAVQDLIGNINYKILESGYRIEILGSNSFEELSDIITKLKIDMLIIDHYDITYEFEKKMKLKFPSLKILSLDDTYKAHYCDILLNHNIYANENKYLSLVPKNCEIQCGKEYTLLRNEFINATSFIKNTSISVFIAMGGSDHKNLNIKILKVLKSFKQIEINIVTTSANQKIEELKEYINCNNKLINLYIDSNQIADIMKSSSFAIITPSVMANEIYFLNIPFISIRTARNQDYMYDFLKKKKIPVIKNFNKKKLKYFISNMLKTFK